MRVKFDLPEDVMDQAARVGVAKWINSDIPDYENDEWLDDMKAVLVAVTPFLVRPIEVAMLERMIGNLEGMNRDVSQDAVLEWLRSYLVAIR